MQVNNSAATLIKYFPLGINKGFSNMPIHTEFKHLSNQITSLYGKNAFRLTLFGNKILVYGLFILILLPNSVNKNVYEVHR